MWPQPDNSRVCAEGLREARALLGSAMIRLPVHGGLITLGILLFVVVGSPLARGEDIKASNPSVVERQVVPGFTFKLPADWPIEEQGGGVTSAIPVEEYLSRKFSALESRLQMLEQRFNGLDLRLRILEQGGGGGGRLRSSGRPGP